MEGLSTREWCTVAQHGMEGTSTRLPPFGHPVALTKPIPILSATGTDPTLAIAQLLHRFRAKVTL